MCIVHRPGHIPHQPGTRPRVVLEPGYVPFEIAAADQLEADIGTTAILAHLVNRHDMRMVEPRDRLGLDAKPLNRVGTRPEGRRPDRLQGHDPAKLLVPGLENDPIPPVAISSINSNCRNPRLP